MSSHRQRCLCSLACSAGIAHEKCALPYGARKRKASQGGRRHSKESFYYNAVTLRSVSRLNTALGLGLGKGTVPHRYRNSLGYLSIKEHLSFGGYTWGYPWGYSWGYSSQQGKPTAAQMVSGYTDSVSCVYLRLYLDQT